MNSSTREMQLLKWGIITLLLLPAYNFYLNGIVQFLLGGSSISAVSYILMALIGVWSYFLFAKYKHGKENFLFVLLLLGTLLAYLLYPDIRSALLASSYNPLDSQALMLFLYCVPAMFISSKVHRWEDIFNIVSRLSMALIPIAIFSYWVQIRTLGVLEINYMSISTFLVLPICAVCSYGYINKKWYPFIFAIVGIIFIFVCGSRGALVCSLVGFIFSIFRYFRKSNIVYKILMAIVIISAIFYFGQSFIRSAGYAVESGLGRGRTLMKLEEGSFFESDGREEINQVINAGIRDNPFGYGLFGDRHIMVKGGLPPSYCHNIIKEFICDYGIVVGTFLLIYLIYMMYKTTKRTKDRYAIEIMVMVICSGVLTLLTSGTYLTDIMFWSMVGIMINPYVKLNK